MLEQNNNEGESIFKPKKDGALSVFKPRARYVYDIYVNKKLRSVFDLDGIRKHQALNGGPASYFIWMGEELEDKKYFLRGIGSYQV